MGKEYEATEDRVQDDMFKSEDEWWVWTPWREREWEYGKWARIWHWKLNNMHRKDNEEVSDINGIPVTLIFESNGFITFIKSMVLINNMKQSPTSSHHKSSQN